ncbi:MAG: asparagine synthase-related protein [Chloracidobacterium sp.]|nr:asparagine synthase-related protein [Chloracidobacterium sp.]
MSSFVVIVQPPGSLIEPDLPARLLQSLVWRGPDGQWQWSDDYVAFGYAHLRVDDLTSVAPPPTFDEQVWLAADIRLDAREELCRALQAAGFDATPADSDAKLLWRAYRAWETDCLRYLHGDFAFALWDALRRRLFCARDRFGVKPLYYSHRPDVFVAASALDTVCAHPNVPSAIPDDLDVFAVADFLIHGMKLDEDGTFFRAVRRMPRAHALCLENGSLRRWRYWDWPTDGRLRYRRSRDYVEHFQAILDKAVADRLRTPRASVFLSGGLDSNVVTAAARRASPTTALHAFTNVFDWLIPDDERRFAQMAAQAHGIPITFIAHDDWRPYAPHPDATQPPPEPVHEPFWSGVMESYRRAAAHSRVLLTGQWGDEALTQETAPYLRELLAQRRVAALVQALAEYFVSDARNGFYSLRRRLGRVRPAPPELDLPQWLAPDFVARLRQSGYFERRADEPPHHPFHSLAVRALSRVHMANDHEYNDPAFTGALVEMRYPLLDLRALEFLLAIPTVPACLDKWLFRESLSHQLPRAVVRRPKTPLRAFPITGYIRKYGAAWTRLPAEDEIRRRLACFVTNDAFDREIVWNAQREAESLIDLGPLTLYKWMQFKLASS